MSKEELIFFEIFPWNANFETGIDLIDEQHKQLVHILNKLAAHLANRSNEIVLNEIFDELADYADYHFKSEEKIWSASFAGDDWYLNHEATHHSFIDDVIALKNNETKKPLDDVIHDIVSFLSQWLAYHILDTDKRMAKAVQAITEGASLEDAKIRANDEMSGSMKVLINTVLSMYDSLSSRTLELMREKALRKQAEEALSRSEERWKFILDGGVENVWDWDIEQNKMSKSEDDVSLFSVLNESLKNPNMSLNIHPSDVEQLRSDFQAHLEGRTEFFTNKHRILRKNGSWSWVLSRGKVVSRDEHGKAVRMVGTHSDITERELAAMIYKDSTQAIFISDMNNDIISINPAFTDITGYTKQDAIGKNPKLLASGKHDKSFFEQMWKSINSVGHWSGEIYNKRKNGEIYPEYLAINTVRDAKGQIDHYFALFNDISEAKRYKKEKKQQEEYILQQSRMAQMGELISMIAHQWKQPLSAISATSIGLRMKIALQKYDLDNQEERDQCNSDMIMGLDEIEKFVENMTMTMNDFRNFYKPDKKKSLTRISAPVASALKIIGASLSASGIEIVQHHEGTSMIEMYENEIMQVVLNIFQNAEDNFKHNKINAPELIISTKSDLNSSRIQICDNGGGIDKDTLSKMFEPYFSTKSENEGTGLGLYLSKIIVEIHHNGELSVYNTPKGACFIIEIFANENRDVV